MKSLRRVAADSLTINRSGSARRPGAVILEVILVMPLLVLLFFAAFEFGIMMLVFTAATHAVVDGAREGALLYPGTTPYDDGNPDPTGNDDIADAIAIQMNRTLAAVGIEIKQDGINDNAQRANAFLRIRRATVVAERGRTSISGNCVEMGQAADGTECVVTLTFPLVSGAPTGHPVPNLLSTFNITFANSFFNATSRARLQ